ncbi:LytR family transcriptional regulator [Nocardioides albidus]|uniref:LytR family transcriptional regulator n=1 Tax=Nocardioides albidus TaxID=1517589 RepID=A0A5C4VKT7_9ACTN|nr:LCP family protein [Nocardioides albidus]TNM36463.1 LytR family transcriptional regulator [Nocardioides albidus]
MTQDDQSASPGAPGRRARRVPTSRADRRRLRGERGGGKAGRRASGGRRKAPQPGKVVVKVILASLVSLGLATGLGVVMIYNNWNGNIARVSLDDQLGNDRPKKQKVAGPREPMNILVMGSDSRDCKGCGVDGESTNGLSDTTILFHLSANRKFAYGISIPRDTAVMRPTCYEPDGSEIRAATTYDKWNAAFSYGGPACTIRQFEQTTGIPLDNYVVVNFGQFKDMVNALDGVEVCIPDDIDDDVRNIHLKAGTREIKGDEALTYVRARYRIGDGTDPNRTRRQQAFIGSMINKALTKGMLARPDRIVGFMNAVTSGLQTDFENVAQMADLAVTAQGIGADNIKFITTPWAYSDKVSSGIEWTPEVEKLWRLVLEDKRLTPEFLKDALSAGDRPDGSASGAPSGGQPSDPASPSDDATSDAPSDDATSESASDSPSESSSGSPSGTPSGGAVNPPGGGLSTSGREAAGLCT